MSTEDRLKRLGLWHLRDDEKALRNELNRRFQKYERERAEIEAEHEEDIVRP